MSALQEMSSLSHEEEQGSVRTKVSTINTDSSGTAVSFEHNRLQFKPQYRLDWDASVNVEQSPVSKELSAKFSNLSLEEDRPSHRLEVSADGSVRRIEPEQQQEPLENHWLPSILKDQWPEQEVVPLEEPSRAPLPYLETNFNDSVVIHNSVKDRLKTEDKIPDWKRAALEAKESKLKVQPKLKKMFEPLESTTPAAGTLELDPQQSTIDSSTFNTAFKLFGQHDSFTSNKLNQIIDNIQKNKLVVQNEAGIVVAQPAITEELENSPQSVVRTEAESSPVKSEADVNKTEDYIKNANALFANLKLRGAPIGPSAGPSGATTEDQEWTNNMTSTTATDSSSLEQSWITNSHTVSQEQRNFTNNETNVDITIDNLAEPADKKTDENDYTSSIEQGSEIYTQQSPVDAEDDTGEISGLDLKTREEMQLFYNRTFPYLQPENRIRTPKIKSNVHNRPILIKPEDFEMRFDENRREWIPNEHNFVPDTPQNDENVMLLEAINDLTTISKKNGQRVESILKHNRVTSVLHPRELNSKSEVSFRLPMDQVSSNSSRDDTFDNKTRSRHSSANTSSAVALFEVTNASQIQDISFSESKRKLINVLSSIEPGGDWDDLVDLQLSDLDLSNLNDFYKIVPHLTSVDLSDNKIHFLDGLPKSMKTIVAPMNLLDNLTSFKKFKQLRYLDISNNSFQSLTGLGGLQNLTTLKASSNQISSLEGISQLDTLTKISLNDNQISGEINFEYFKFENLQKLDLSGNHIQSLIGLDHLPNLVSLKLDENRIESLRCNSEHALLKKLCLNMNLLSELPTDMFPHLRVLRIDGNRFNGEDSISLKKLGYLQELSCKCQVDQHFLDQLEAYCTDVRLLDLSGITRLRFDNTGMFSSVSNLTLSAMNLKSVPSNFSELCPNVSYLNLNFNNITDISLLQGLKRLKHLYMVSNEIEDLEMVIMALAGSRQTITRLDLRLNRINRGFYSYVFSSHETESNRGKIEQEEVPEVSVIHLDTVDDIQSFSIHYKYLLDSAYKDVSDWALRDKAHLNNLKLEHSRLKDEHNSGGGFNSDDDSIYIRRLNYECIMLRLCNRLKFFDGKLVGKDDMIDAKIRIQDLFSSH